MLWNELHVLHSEVILSFHLFFPSKVECTEYYFCATRIHGSPNATAVHIMIWPTICRCVSIKVLLVDPLLSSWTASDPILTCCKDDYSYIILLTTTTILQLGVVNILWTVILSYAVDRSFVTV